MLRGIRAAAAPQPRCMRPSGGPNIGGGEQRGTTWQTRMCEPSGSYTIRCKSRKNTSPTPRVCESNQTLLQKSLQSCTSPRQSTHPPPAQTRHNGNPIKTKNTPHTHHPHTRHYHVRYHPSPQGESGTTPPKGVATTFNTATTKETKPPNPPPSGKRGSRCGFLLRGV